LLAKELREQADLKRKLAEAEDDKLTLEQQLETGFKIGQGASNRVKDVNLARHK